MSSHLSPDAGAAIMTHGNIHVVADAGPFGAAGAGHSHSDTLSIVVRRGEADILIDPGTYTYISDPEWRTRFRGSAAHNTVRVNGREQAVPAGPFRWNDKPPVLVHEWTAQPDVDRIDASCTYGDIRHRRVVAFQKPDCVIVFDEIQYSGEMTVEQFWHPDRVISQTGNGSCFDLGSGAFLALSSAEAIVETGGEYGWRSRALGAKEPSPVIRIRFSGAGSIVLAAAIVFDGGSCSREGKSVRTRMASGDIRQQRRSRDGCNSASKPQGRISSRGRVQDPKRNKGKTQAPPPRWE